MGFNSGFKGLNKIGCWYVDRKCVAYVGIGLAAPIDTVMNYILI